MNQKMYDWALTLLTEPAKWHQDELQNAVLTLQEALAGKYGPDPIKTLQR